MFEIEAMHRVAFCSNNGSMIPVWSNRGLSRCFMDTVSSSYFMFIMTLGCLQVILLWRRAVSWRKDDLPRPFWFRIQIFTSLLMICQYIARVVVHGVMGPKPLPAYLELSTCFCLASYSISILVLLLERSKTMSGRRIKGHGILLLLFWTGAFLNENLAIISWGSQLYWWSPSSDLDKADLGLWIARYVLTLCLFGMGLKAPGLPPAGYQLLINAERDSTIQDGGPTSVSDTTSTWSSVMKKLYMIWPYVWPKGNYLMQLRVVFCMFLLISGRVVNVFVPILNKNIIDALGAKVFPWQQILIYISLKLAQGGGFGGLGFLNNFRTFMWIRVQQYTTKGIMVRLFSHLHSLSLQWHLNRKTGEVLRIMDRGTLSINSLLSYVVFNILPTIFDIIIAIVYFVTGFNAWFGLIVLVAMALYLVCTIVITEWRTKFRRQMNLADNRKKQKAVDSLLNFETVKYYGNEQFEVNLYSGAIDEYQVEEWKSTASLNILNTAQNFVVNMGVLVGCLLCAHMVVSDGLTVGDYVLFSTYIMQLYTPLNFFGTYYRMIQQAFIDMENMIDLLDEKQDVVDTDCDKELVLTNGCIEFDRVSFFYNKEKPILKDISFKVQPGQSIALVGPSGAGKSTIIRLLFRFYDINGGVIRIDGQDVKEVTQKSLRRCIGVVPQDTVLFNNKIKYNIRYGKIDCTDGELESAAAAADIHSRILSFPEGYETVVGERGLKLSGGEKQRVAIARTILKAPQIVLLDEATSALDTKTERNIQASLSDVCKNRTTIVVAHRLSTIIHSDQILVLADGRIIERGTHEELLELGGVYSEMWMEQLKAQLERNGDSSEGESDAQKMD